MPKFELKFNVVPQLTTFRDAPYMTTLHYVHYGT
jgi:hypothetical protein